MSTAGREQVVVVGLTVRPPVSLKEVAGAQLLLAVTTGEMFWVPDLTESCDHLQPMVPTSVM